MKKKLLFLDILTDDPKIAKKLNKEIYSGQDYFTAFCQVAKLKSSQVKLAAGHINTLPSLNNVSAVIIGGSTLDPIKGQEKPWMINLYKYIRQIVKQGIPLLGICGGLQFTVRALGGEVIYNPKGRRFGNFVTELNKAGQKDFLFKDLPKKFLVTSSHKCIVGKLPKGFRVLGKTKNSPYEVIAYGKNVRLTQYHPEMTKTTLVRLAKMRKQALIAEKYLNSKNFSQFIKKQKNTTVIGKKIINNFLDAI